MEMIITIKGKIKAKKRRIKNEKKWILFRVISAISMILFMIALVIGVFGLSYEDYKKVGICGVIFSVFLIVFIIMRAMLANFTSHWITDRLNERIWIKDRVLYHFIQTSFAAGINSRSADETGYLFAMDMQSIHEAKYDEKSGRIEFKTNGRGMHYADHMKGIVDKEWGLYDFDAVFYDYTEPSLYRVLKEAGVVFSKETLDFKIRDNRI